jgi:hypothetical protein
VTTTAAAGTIAPAPLTLSATADRKVYDGSTGLGRDADRRPAW